MRRDARRSITGSIVDKENVNVSSSRRIVRRGSRGALRALGLALVLCGLAAAPATAAPSFEIEMVNDANEVQAVVLMADAGQYKLSYKGDVTPDLNVGDSAAQVEAVLNALPSISAGGGSVSVLPNGGQAKNGMVTFDGGPLAGTDVPPIKMELGSTPLTGGAAAALVTTIAPGGVARNDERVDYEVDIKNVAANAPLTAGDTLTCHPNTWSGSGSPSFAFQWLRNGASIGGATSSTYTTVPADEGAVIQCRVIATNTVADASDPADFAGSTRVSAGVIVEPQPGTAPPTPPASIAIPAQTGSLNGTADRELTCNAGAWTGSPTSYTYQWYRNGVAIGAPVGPTAETSTKLTLTAAEQSPPAAFQCIVNGENASGARAKASGNRNTASPLAPNPSAPNNADTLFITTPNQAAGPVTVEVELPAGEGTAVFEGAGETGGTGWSCTSSPASGAEPAKATCSRSDVLAPGASYPTLNVATELGADAPDPAVATATVSGGGAAPTTDSDEFDFLPARVFEIEAFDSEVINADNTDYTQAGGHPHSGFVNLAFMTRKLPFNELQFPVKQPRQVITDLPRGFVGNALSVPQLCPGVADVIASTCPAGSAVGEINVDVAVNANGGAAGISMPLFAIEPEFGTPAQFAFAELGNSQAIFTLTARLRPEDGYAISLDTTPAPGGFALRTVQRAGFCTFGANVTGNKFESCKKAGDPNANPVPLITNPTRCSGAPPAVTMRVDSWNDPGEFVTSTAVDPLPTGCEKVDFQPKVSLTPTSGQADSPTGVDVEISMPTEGLEDPEGLAQSNLANAVVTLPKGMSVNPAAAHGLGSCSPGQVKLGSNVPADCPLSSQVGTIEIDTPLISETLTGHVFMASQKNNPFDSTLGLYLVFSSEKDGVTIKVAGKLEPDPVTGQLTASFLENPEAPFSRLSIKFNAGPRAPLVNPVKCGTYAIHSELSPWSAVDPAHPTKAEIVEDDSVYRVTSGPNGAPCPSGALAPKVQTGLQNPIAGSKSPFVLKLSRDEGTQRFTALDVSMPPGLVAYLKGIPYCPDAVLAGISGAELTGRPELASPACPAASQVGTVQAGAGAGPLPFYAEGRVYLAGPYRGAPLSLAVVTPAVAGPFDLGNVVIRNAVHVNPETAEVTAKSDPIPTILHGLLLNIRDIRVNIDRPGFTAAPTSCKPTAVGTRIGGEDGRSVQLSNRFQVGECAALDFKPRLYTRLFGGVKRGAFPKLRGVIVAGKGEANIGRAAVTLPRSEFLEQGHIRTICTRVQFAADSCPKAAIYGYARAITPLLDHPVVGPVYMRSSNNKLPDIVARLRGPAHQPIEAIVVGRVDSVRGQIRTTFENTPDVPLSKFILTMQGGKKGLLVNSRNVCVRQGRNRATVRLAGHNGKRFTSRPVLNHRKCRKLRHAKRKKAKRSAHRSALAGLARGSAGR